MAGTDLFASDGIDVAALVAEHLGPRVLPAVLIRPGAPGERDPDNPTQAPVAGEPTQFPCRGLIENFSTYVIDGTLIKATDRKVTLLGGTLSTVPEAGVGKDSVMIEGDTWPIYEVLSRDPAGATYVLQVRK